MPNDLIEVIEAIAELRGSSPDAIARAVHENMLRLLEQDVWLADIRALLEKDFSRSLS